MTKEKFIKNVEIEIDCLQEANYIYSCEQLQNNIMHLETALQSVRQMNDSVFSSWWRVMRTEFEYLENYYNEDYEVPDFVDYVPF